jgi:nicotinamidase-related amidase
MDRIAPETSVLVCVDVQERLAAAMPPDAMERLTSNASILLESARLVHAAVIASEQYPTGLGPTIAPIKERMEACRITPIEKMTFDAFGEPTLARRLSEKGARSVIVIGMETHVCVFQTVRELVRRGYATYVVADAVASRREENRQAGLSLCERAGAVVTVTEAVVFDWLERAGTETFRAVSKLVR